MESVKGFLVNRLKLTVNESKSAVARPWERKFLGYSVSAQQSSKIRIAKQSIERLMDAVRQLSIGGKGGSLPQTIEKLNPLLRGWMNYFSLSQSRRPIVELDAWVRRRLRCLVWRQWKRPRTRETKMRALGLDAQRAWKSSVNGRGPWWNAGAKHMIAALPPRHFTQLGLVSLVVTHQQLQRSI
jgi:RNA-directed DNA polymerase